MKVVNYGSINIDRVYQVDDLVKAGETKKVSAYYEYPGGKGLNQSVAMARGGLNIYHAGKIGRDGSHLISFLKDQGVCTDDIRQDEGASGHAIIQVDDRGENSILVVGAANARITSEEKEEVLSKMEPGDVLLLQNEINGLEDFLSLARTRGITLVLNPSPLTPDLERIDFKYVDYLILNAHEALVLSKSATIDQAMSYFLRKNEAIKLVVTLGDQGLVYQDKDQTLKVPAISVKPVDTTGAGDTFLGYFISSLYRDCDLRHALELASYAAAMAVERPGAASSIPYLNEVLDRIKDSSKLLP